MAKRSFCFVWSHAGVQIRLCSFLYCCWRLQTIPGNLQDFRLQVGSLSRFQSSVHFHLQHAALEIPVIAHAIQYSRDSPACQTA
jgi:hypothetical protein